MLLEIILELIDGDFFRDARDAYLKLIFATCVGCEIAGFAGFGWSGNAGDGFWKPWNVAGCWSSSLGMGHSYKMNVGGYGKEKTRYY